MQQYESVLPGIASQMARMFDANARHRMDLQSRMMSLDEEQAKRQYRLAGAGLTAVFVLMAMLIATVALAFVLKQKTEAAIVGALTAVVSGILATVRFTRRRPVSANPKPPP